MDNIIVDYVNAVHSQAETWIGRLVSTMNGKGLDGQHIAVKSPATARDVALQHTQRPIQLVQESLSPGVKRSGRKANHSPLHSAQVKK
jgi:hypothetical protein